MSGKQKINAYAIASLALGIIGVWLNLFLIGLCAVYAGEKFRRRNKEAGGALKGRVLALIGTILGIIPLLTMVITAITHNLV